MRHAHKRLSCLARVFPAVILLLAAGLLGCRSGATTQKTGRQIMSATTSKGQRGEARPVRREPPREARIAEARRPDKPAVAMAPEPFKPKPGETRVSQPGASPTVVQKPDASPQPEPSKTFPTAGPEPLKPDANAGTTSPDSQAKDSSKTLWRVTGGKLSGP